MRGGPSSRPDGGRLNGFHVAISSFAALAGVAIAAYQVLAPSVKDQQAVNVTVALDPAAQTQPANMVIGKTDAVSLPTATVDLASTASFAAALNDGSDSRYDFRKLFDGDGGTSLMLNGADSEVNVLVTFAGAEAQPVTAITYTPPAVTGTTPMAKEVDVTVLPEGQLQAAGMPVFSFTLQSSPGSQTFAIPGHISGRGLWLRVSGAPGAAIGDFHILHEQAAP
ncbi:hypothetical protein [Aestuariivirga sp.]|uniref:hypothetical protein n=1 Tax=Aestuariivirga sp. TaxID=2650926 RepID=UPI0039E67854